MLSPDRETSWLALIDGELPVGEAYRWCLRPHCGAVVVFSGIVRDHAVDGDEVRQGVGWLTYEAYDQQVVPAFTAIEAEARRQWPDIAQVAILHRVGRVELSESAVVVAVSAPHRGQAFDAGRWIIDTVKASAPIWKHEEWAGGAGWGTGAHVVSAPISATAQGSSR